MLAASKAKGGKRKAKALTDAYAAAVLANHPLAYYRLDDSGTTAADSSGNGLSGAIGSGVTTGVGGLLPQSSDTAMRVPGTQSAAGAVVVPPTSLLQLQTNVSVEAWIQFSAAPKTYSVVLAYGTDSSYAPYDLFFRAGSKLVAQFFLAGGVLEVAAPAALAPNTPYYVVSTYDGTTGRLYVNGTQVASVAKTGKLSDYDPQHGLAIGDDAGFTDPAFNGVVDEVAVYGTTLAASDVAGHYNAAETGQGPPPTPTPTPTATPTPTPPPSSAYANAVLNSAPVAYYRLTDSGTTAVDSSGNGLNGTIGSGVTTGLPGLVQSSTDTAMGLPGAQSATGAVVVKANAKFQAQAQVSIEAFVQLNAAPKPYAVLLSYGSDSTFAPYDLYLTPGGNLSAQFTLTSGELIVSAPAPLALNTTYDAVATYDGTTGSLYLNGALVASATKSGALTAYDTTHGLAIGDDAGFSDPGTHATVGEVAIYTHALAASDVAAHFAAAQQGAPPPPTPTPTANPYVDWSTYGYDGARTGYNPSEQTLSASSVGGLQLLWSQTFKGVMTAQPLLATNVTAGSVTQNVLYVGTHAGLFLALNADTGATIWQTQLQTAAYNCGSNLSTGVDRSATFDRSTNRVYVEDGQDIVHALDMGTGAEAPGWPVQIPSTTPGHDFPHGGLNYNPANHLLYATSSSTCDITPWFGRVVAINTQSATVAGTFFPAQGQSGGGIWGPGGASIDPLTQNVFVAVGNADTTGGNPQTFGYSENVVQLNPTLGLVAANYPPGISGGDDLDFGATPLLFSPPGCNAQAVAMNKSGLIAEYDRTNMSGGPVEALVVNPTTDNADFVGLPAYSPALNLVFVPMPNDFTSGGIAYTHGMMALAMRANCTFNPTPVWDTPFGILPAQEPLADPHSPPTVANGVVFVSDGPNKVVYALNAQTGQILWTSGSTITNGGVYAAPLADKNLYAVAYGGTVYAFGLGGANAGKRHGVPHAAPSRVVPATAQVRAASH
jgi:outer membrane protein assembly factor BamB